MVIKPSQTHIAYRCPDCGSLVFGLVGKFALSANFLRLKCSCGKSSLDISIENGQKIRLSVPCFLCRTNHSFVVSQSIFFGRDLFLLNCPYANVDIAFLGEEDKVKEEADRADKQLDELIRSVEGEKLSDIQPEDVDPAEVLPDPEIYDIVRFLVKELEADGKIDCPCHSGEYDFRFTDGGVEVYCPTCGASYVFPAESASVAREYLTVEEIRLK